MDKAQAKKLYRRSKISYGFSLGLWIFITIWFAYGYIENMKECALGNCGEGGAGLGFVILLVWVPYTLYTIIYTVIFLIKRSQYINLQDNIRN